jgi:hypothetical protein
MSESFTFCKVIIAKVFASEGHKIKVKTAFFAIKMEFLSAFFIEGKSKETTYTYEKNCEDILEC